MDTDDLKRKLAEYDALKGDLDASVRWTDDNPPPKMLITCKCGKSKPREYQLNWGDVRQELGLRGFLRTEFESPVCEVCEPDTETDDD